MKILSICCIVLCVATISYVVYIYWESRKFDLSDEDEEVARY